MGRIIHYGFVLALIALAAAGGLASVNKMTSPVIKDIEKNLVEDAQRDVLKGAVSFDSENAIEKDEMTFIPAMDADGNKLGYVVAVASPGYAGDIKFVMGISSTYKVTGLKIIDSKETPGLGAKIASNKSWIDHWNGMDSSYEFDKTDAFAGATISPKAVYTGMIKALTAIEGDK